jgi:FkbM family methyltransferase
MSGGSRLFPALSGLYRLARGTGLLDLPWFRGLYTRAYFTYKRHLEDPFAGLVRSRPELFAEGHILDVGANIGYTAAIFLEVLSPGFKIYAFEPDEWNLRALRETVRARHAEGRIVPVPCAAGDVDGEAELWHNPAHPGDHHLLTPAARRTVADEQTTRVAVRTLDGFLASEGQGMSAVAFIKIDVQGAELAVFRGMALSLERCPQAVVAFEYDPAQMRSLGFDPAVAVAFFASRGYRLHILRKDGSLEPADEPRIAAALHGRGYVDLVASARELVG